MRCRTIPELTNLFNATRSKTRQKFNVAKRSIVDAGHSAEGTARRDFRIKTEGSH